jgi:zinc transporter ZupT
LVKDVEINMDMTNIWLAIGLTTFAGLATGLGGLIILLFESTNTKILSIALGFSAGVMIYISFVELLADSKEMLVATLGQNLGSIVNLLSFFAGILLIAIIDKIVPSPENPHEAPPKEGSSEGYTLNDEGYVKLGSGAGNGAILSEDAEVKFTVKWGEQEEHFILKAH